MGAGAKEVNASSGEIIAIPDSLLKAERMTTGHEARPAWLASHSRGIEPGEPRAALGEAIDIGRFRIRVAITTEVTIAQVIGKIVRWPFECPSSPAAVERSGIVARCSALSGRSLIFNYQSACIVYSVQKRHHPVLLEILVNRFPYPLEMTVIINNYDSLW